jgi:hypothetical protein
MRHGFSYRVLQLGIALSHESISRHALCVTARPRVP